MESGFKVGDTVRIRSLRKDGKVVAVVNRGTLKVRVGGIEISCKLQDVSLPSAAEPDSKKVIVRKKSTHAIRQKKKKTATELDLHGIKVAEAKEMLLSFVSDAIMAGHREVRIIHGHGKGIIKDMVHSTLNELQLVLSLRHPPNTTAVTIVRLK